jgi:hypothetical protein
MSVKTYNLYKITHLNGKRECINAFSPVQALENMATPESESPVTTLLLDKRGIPTVVTEAPVNWVAQAYPAEAVEAGCLAFPTNGTSEAGSNLKLIEVAKAGFTFDHWEDNNGNNLGIEEILDITVTPLADGEASREYKAIFVEA